MILCLIENLSGDYVLELNIFNFGFGVNFEVEFDFQVVCEDCWYFVDMLVVDLGFSDLIGYLVYVDFFVELWLVSFQVGEVYFDCFD